MGTFRMYTGSDGQTHIETIDLDKVLEGIFAAKSHGLYPIKLNAVIERGVNDDDILPLVEFSRQHGFRDFS